MLTQREFVESCLVKYQQEEIPTNQVWEDAHYPTPKCKGGTEIIKLWSSDHTLQGILQSAELDHRCFHHRANTQDLFNLTSYYPEYLELFESLKVKFNTRVGRENASSGGRKCVELGLGIHAPGGKSYGHRKCEELGVGIHSPGVRSKAGKIGGRVSAKILNSQRWKCTVTGHISTPGGLSRYQKSRGIDTSLRIRVT